jgi:hypothetical protein
LNKTGLLVDSLKDQEVNSGDFVLVVHRNNEEILRINGLTRSEGFAAFDSIKADRDYSDSFTFKPGQELTKGKKIGIKIFVGLFLGFGVLSLIIRLKDYVRNGNGWNIFNTTITIVFIILLCYGIWIYFFGNAKNKNGNEGG